MRACHHELNKQQAANVIPPAESPDPPLALPLVADVVADDPVAVADMLLAEFPVE